MKKLFFFVCIVFACLSFYNLQAQKLKLSPNASLGRKIIPVEGVIHHKDKAYGEYVYHLGKDKITLWKNSSLFGLLKKEVNLSDVKSVDNGGLYLLENVMKNEQGKDVPIYTIYFSLEEGKICQETHYTEEENKILPQEECSPNADIMFTNKKEAEEVLAKIKALLKK